jgi:hypothetical protein
VVSQRVARLIHRVGVGRFTHTPHTPHIRQRARASTYGDDTRVVSSRSETTGAAPTLWTNLVNEKVVHLVQRVGRFEEAPAGCSLANHWPKHAPAPPRCLATDLTLIVRNRCVSAFTALTGVDRRWPVLVLDDYCPNRSWNNLRCPLIRP